MSETVVGMFEAMRSGSMLAVECLTRVFLQRDVWEKRGKRRKKTLDLVNHSTLYV